MASFMPGGKKNSKSPAFPPVQTTALGYSNFSLDNAGDYSGTEEQEDSDDNDISDEASEDDEYEEESSDTTDTRRLASKRMDDIDMDTAASYCYLPKESWQRDQDPCLILNRSRAWPV